MDNYEDIETIFIPKKRILSPKRILRRRSKEINKQNKSSKKRVNIESSKYSKYTKIHSPSRHPLSSSRILKTSRRNKLCTSDLEDCASIQLGNIIYIGGGAYGSVFRTEVENHLMAIKMILTIDPRSRSTQELLKKEIFAQKEINMSVAMGENKIGPNVINVVNYIIESNELSDYPIVNHMIMLAKENNKDLEIDLDDNKNHEVFVQFIIMDAYETDCYYALDDDKYTSEHPIIFEQMVDIIKKQIDLGIYCYDIKPSNFIVNLKPVDVRMIDFGADYCNNDINDAFPPNPIIDHLSTIISKKKLLLFSNCLQLLLFYVTGDGKDSFARKSMTDIIKCIDTIFVYFPLIHDFTWVYKIIVPYIKLAYFYDKKEMYKPPTMMMYYAHLPYTTPEETIKTIMTILFE